MTVRSGATLNLADGVTMVVDSKNGCCVYPFDGGTVNVSGGTYENRTTEDYQYKAGFRGMTINQANNKGQLVNITGGTFKGNDPQLGDDSNGARFVSMGYVAMPDANAARTYHVVEGGVVTFDTDGGEPATIAEQRIAKNGKVLRPADPTKANYVFGGWNNGTAAWDFDTNVITEDITLTAQWTDAVAKIGDVYYVTLADAVAAAEDGETVTLLADLVSANALTQRVDVNASGKAITIDLNGKTIAVTHTSGNGSAFNIVSGTVTIKNGTIDGTGVMEGTAGGVTVADGICLVTVRSGATLNLEDGVAMVVNSKNGCCVYPFDGGTVNISGGTYENKTTEVYQYKDGFRGMTVNQENVADQLIHITGGTFKGNDPQLGDDSTGARFVESGYVAMPADGTIAGENGTYTVVPGGVITFVNDDGTELQNNRLEKDVTPKYTGATPTKAATAEFTYTFAGWTPEVVAVTGDAEYKATFTATKNSYTITWKNDNGSVIDTTTVEYGVVPTHADATKAATAEFIYTFAGWTPEVAAVTGDATYTATYTATALITVTFDANGGTFSDNETVKTVSVASDTAIPGNEKPTAPTRPGYTFVGWFEAIDPTSTPVTLSDTAFDFTANITEAKTIYAKWEGDASYFSGLSIYATASLDESINLNLYIQYLPEGTKPEDYSVRVTFNESQSSFTYSPTDETKTAGRYRHQLVETYAYQMTLPITFTLLYNQDVVIRNIEDYSVMKYMLYRFTANDASELERALMKAALDYGAVAQEYFDSKYETNVGHLANATTNPSNVIVATRPTQAAVYSNTIESISDASANMVYDSVNYIRFRFRDSGDLEGITISLDGDGFAMKEPVKEPSGKYMIEISGMTSPKLCDSFTLTMTKGSQSTTLTYSAYAYANFMWNDATNGKLAQALVAYGDAAKAFFG